MQKKKIKSKLTKEPEQPLTSIVLFHQYISITLDCPKNMKASKFKLNQNYHQEQIFEYNDNLANI
jgi:hypothetical protein